MQPAAMLAMLRRYFETGRHLRPMQALYWLFRGGLGRRYRVPRGRHIERRRHIAMTAMAPTAATELSGNAFRFLNESHRFPGEIGWHHPSHPLLWRYNLHYFDFSLDPSRDPAWVIASMQSWIAKVPPGKNTGWQPYPASLRIVNWIKFALLHPDFASRDTAWQTSLYQQVAWLERNLEHEIQANHLLKNAKALYFGGAYFAGPIAERWRRKGLRLLLRECRDQFLGDGGHYERSAMYHAIALEDLLDVISLARATPALLAARELQELSDIAAAASAYLAEIVHPDGSLPMFNDSVAGIAKDAATLADYANAVLGRSSTAPSTTILIEKPVAGYFGYRHADEMLLLDAGPIGPAHQPGHGHCDLLSFELVIAGKSVVVDSGVFDYENTTLRHTLRCSAAHNVLQIDRIEQSDVWGCFRVGRRAVPGKTTLQSDLPTTFQFTGTHAGYAHLPGHPEHHRHIACKIGRSWQVTDHVLGSGYHLLESYIHFHPDFALQPDGEDWLLLDDTGTRCFRIRVNGGHGELQHTEYCPAFGIRYANQTLRLSLSARLPQTLGYVIEAF